MIKCGIQRRESLQDNGRQVSEMKYLLGIDVGTTGTKSLLFSEEGTLLGSAYRAYPTAMPGLELREQDPEDWWHAVVETVHEVCAEPEIGRHVAGISLSLQGGTMAPVDENFDPVRPAMVWSDKRCAAQKEAYLREVGEADTMYRKTGWKLGNGLNANQIRWMRDNEPENFARTKLFLSVPDYISLKMTGVAACDMSDAGINQLANIREFAYDPQLLAFAGITEEQLPKLVRSGEVIGHLTEQAAAELGLTTDCVLVGGAHDQYAVALGAGACNAGDILIGSGTAWVVTAIGDAPDFDSGFAQSVAASPGKWGTLRSLGTGGVCLEWWRKNLTVGPDHEPVSYAVINEEVARRRAAEDGLFFYPFSGRATQEKGFRKATFVGLDLSHDRFDMARAIMEGVAFQIVWMMEAFKTKPSKEGLKLAGGAAKSELWCQILADIANLPVRIPEVADLACVGAAVLAGAGCGVFASQEEGCRRLAVKERLIQPDFRRAEQYAVLRKEYQRYAEALGAAYQL